MRSDAERFRDIDDAIAVRPRTTVEHAVGSMTAGLRRGHGADSSRSGRSGEATDLRAFAGPTCAGSLRSVARLGTRAVLAAAHSISTCPCCLDQRPPLQKASASGYGEDEGREEAGECRTMHAHCIRCNSNMQRA